VLAFLLVSWSALKQATARVIGLGCSLDRLVGRAGGRYVMAYHRVIPALAAATDYVHSAMWIRPETLAAQIRWMRTVGEIVDLETLIRADNRPSTRALFALTFDDGWLDNYTLAFPVLREAQVPATIFLVSDAMEHGRLFWTEDVVTKTHHIAMRGGGRRVLDALAEQWPIVERHAKPSSASALCESWVETLKLVPEQERRARIDSYFSAIGAEREPLRGYVMTWKHAREMAKDGITFGSHTHTHRILEGLDAAAIESELTVSRATISAQLQRDVTLFCYPNARYSGNEGEVLGRCGYRYGFILDKRQVRAPIDPYHIPRFLMNERLVGNHDVVRLHLLEVPLFAGRRHRPRRVNGSTPRQPVVPDFARRPRG
jgi:peptidoglycan/xylan/chitin deacetylase (PgdA/CDA1 family)